MATIKVPSHHCVPLYVSALSTAPEARNALGSNAPSFTPALCALCRMAGVLTSGTIAPRGRVMSERDVAALSGLIRKHEAELLTAWMRNQLDRSVGPNQRGRTGGSVAAVSARVR